MIADVQIASLNSANMSKHASSSRVSTSVFHTIEVANRFDQSMSNHSVNKKFLS